MSKKEDNINDLPEKRMKGEIINVEELILIRNYSELVNYLTECGYSFTGKPDKKHVRSFFTIDTGFATFDFRIRANINNSVIVGFYVKKQLKDNKCEYIGFSQGLHEVFKQAS